MLVYIFIAIFTYTLRRRKELKKRPRETKSENVVISLFNLFNNFSFNRHFIASIMMICV